MAKRQRWGLGLWAFAILAVAPPAARAADEGGKAGVGASGDAVSYYKEIRPVFQAHCQGCHQPAKAGGGYVMTSFDRLRKGGESGLAAVVPGKPEESHLVEQITPGDGKAEMPRDRPPL